MAKLKDWFKSLAPVVGSAFGPWGTVAGSALSAGIGMRDEKKARRAQAAMDPDPRSVVDPDARGAYQKMIEWANQYQAKPALDTGLLMREEQASGKRQLSRGLERSERSMMDALTKIGGQSQTGDIAKGLMELERGYSTDLYENLGKTSRYFRQLAPQLEADKLRLSSSIMGQGAAGLQSQQGMVFDALLGKSRQFAAQQKEGQEGLAELMSPLAGALGDIDWGSIISDWNPMAKKSAAKATTSTVAKSNPAKAVSLYGKAR